MTVARRLTNGDVTRLVKCTVCGAKRGAYCHIDGSITFGPYAIGVHSARVSDAQALRTQRRVDLFKDTYASRLLRLALECGTTTLVALKNEQHRLGGAQGNIMHTLGTYTGSRGAVLQRGGKLNRSIAIHWIGSTGETFFERASNWLATLDDRQLEDAHGRVEIEFIEAGAAGDKLRATGDWLGDTLDEMRAMSWLKLVQYAIGTRTARVAA